MQSAILIYNTVRLSARLFVCPTRCCILSKQMHITSKFLDLLVQTGWSIILFFLSSTVVTKFQAEPSQQDVKYRTLVIFDRNRRSARKRYEISPRLLWIINRYPIDPCSSNDFEWPWMAARKEPIYRDLRTCARGEMCVSLDQGHAPLSQIGGPQRRQRPQFWGPPTYAHMVWHTSTKFCRVIKLNERKILQGPPRPRPWPEIFRQERGRAIYLRYS